MNENITERILKVKLDYNIEKVIKTDDIKYRIKCLDILEEIQEKLGYGKFEAYRNIYLIRVSEWLRNSTHNIIYSPVG